MGKADNILPDPERDGQYAFVCPDCEFTSSGWDTKAGATARGDEHFTEHDTGEPAPELMDSGARGATGRR